MSGIGLPESVPSGRPSNVMLFGPSNRIVRLPTFDGAEMTLADSGRERATGSVASNARRRMSDGGLNQQDTISAGYHSGLVTGQDARRFQAPHDAPQVVESCAATVQLYWLHEHNIRDGERRGVPSVCCLAGTG